MVRCVFSSLYAIPVGPKLSELCPAESRMVFEDFWNRRRRCNKAHFEIQDDPQTRSSMDNAEVQTQTVPLDLSGLPTGAILDTYGHDSDNHHHGPQKNNALERGRDKGNEYLTSWTGS